MIRKFKRFVKGFLIAGSVISATEKRTGEDIRRAKSQKKRHRLPAAMRARIDYARTYAKDARDTLDIPDHV